MEGKKQKGGRVYGLSVCVAAYLVAGLAAWAAAVLCDFESPVWTAAVADVAATLAIFAFSRAWNNSSIYDPYWSVIPPVIGGYWLLVPGGGVPLRQAAVLFVLSAWAVRLTWNWLRGWDGLSHEDWRYVDLQTQHGPRYWWVSFAGIHMFPTVVVFLGCLPLWPALTSPNRALGVLDAVALLVAGGAVLIETVADEQLRSFRRAQASGAHSADGDGSAAIPGGGKILDTGLWAWSRHPNYFGEMLFWWGLYLFGVAASPESWWMFLGAASITVMFVTISIPMIDERSCKRRPGYAEHMKKVPALFPWPPGSRVS